MNIRTIVMMSACCLALQAWPQMEKFETYDNPIVWADAPDPDVIRVGDTFFNCIPGLPILHSRDLVNWQLAGYVFDRLTDSPRYDLLGGTVYGRGQWATSLKHHN